MVSIRRVSGSKNPAEMTYYVQHNGVPLSGTSAAKVLNTVDSQTMALTVGYFVQLQAERKHSVHPWCLTSGKIDRNGDRQTTRTKTHESC